jgi:hypothetical protein
MASRLYGNTVTQPWTRHVQLCRYTQPSAPRKSIWALWTSLLRFQHAPYRPALAETLPLHLQLTFLPPRSLSQHNPQFISVSLHCLRSVLLVVSPWQASIWISTCATPPGLGLYLPPSSSSHHLFDDIVGLKA